MKAYGKAFDALGDPTRRAILEQLMRGPLAVVDLASRVPISRPAVSQHLRVLKEARLVHDRQSGARRIYQISPDGIAKMRAYLDTFWERALEQLKVSAENQTRKGKL
ncbi:MAG TPA: metalloregulator ArsR/SmtB family transcription factor [Candidatus Eremiobacteraceae bacterium]